MTKDVYIGVDAGGTKTIAAVSGMDGTILGMGQDIGANIDTHTPELAWERIVSAIDQALRKLKDTRLSVETVCVGLAGLNSEYSVERMTSFLSQNSLHYPVKTVIVVNDTFIGLKSAAKVDYGICLVAGTGAHCYGITPDGNEAAAGGWSYLIGDQGSGFYLGQRILKRAMQEYDGRASDTGILPILKDYFGNRDMAQVASEIYADADPIALIASITGMIEKAAHLPIVQAFINDTTDAMVESYKAVWRRLLYSSKRPVPVVLIGGLFDLTKLVTTPVKQRIMHVTPYARVIRPRNAPYHGALTVAKTYTKGALLPVSAMIMSY